MKGKIENVLAVAGVVCIAGGESLCIFGPMKYENVIHIVCHIILYSGIGLVAGGGAVHGAEVFRNRKSGQV